MVVAREFEFTKFVLVVAVLPFTILLNTKLLVVVDILSVLVVVAIKLASEVVAIEPPIFEVSSPVEDANVRVFAVINLLMLVVARVVVPVNVFAPENV